MTSQTSHARIHGRFLLKVATIALLGCGPSPTPDAGVERDATASDTPADTLPTDAVADVTESDVLGSDTPIDAGSDVTCGPSGTLEKLDLLFVVDNSGSMMEEQASLVAQIPRLIRVLTSGDRNEDGIGDFSPISDLHIGVVTTDMGTGQPSSDACVINPMMGDDGVLQNPGCAAGPSFLTFRPEDAGIVARLEEAACILEPGTAGCGFEQQLEAMLKAVTPSDSEITFAGETTGHADGANEGFLRSDALLGIVMITDEDDCSASNLDIFNFDPDGPFEGSPNLRCFENAGPNDGLDGEGELHPIRRFVDGVIASRGSADRVVFAPIVGVPTRLVGAEYDDMLSDPEMQAMIDPDCSLPAMDRPRGCPRLRASCDVPGLGLAFPPRRIVRAAQMFEERGVASVVQSICQDDFTPAIDAMIARLPELVDCTP